MQKLKFSNANAKTKKTQSLLGLGTLYSLDLLSGHSCPSARECLSRVMIVDGKRKVRDGKDCNFRCFSASQEALFTNVYNARKHNFDLIKGCKSMKQIYNLIKDSIPADAKVIRMHVAGDFFKQSYFDAVVKYAADHPGVRFYAYTKNLPAWIKMIGKVPNNFKLIASFGGKYDRLIDVYKLPFAKVVKSEAEADALGLEIDDNDMHAATGSGSCALLIHGTQPKKYLKGK